MSGDLSRTSADLANATTAVQGRLENLAATIGKALNPAFKAFEAFKNEVLIDLTEVFEGGKSRLEEFAEVVKSKIELLGSLYRNWGLIVERTQLRIGIFIINMGEQLWNVAKIVGAVAKYIFDAFVAAFDSILGVLLNLKDNMLKVFQEIFDYIKSGGKHPIEIKLKPILDNVKFNAPQFQMPDTSLTNIDDQIKAIDDQIRANDDKIKAANKPAERAKIAPLSNIDEVAKKKKQSVEVSSLDEFAKKLQGGVFGKKDPVQQGILANGQAQVGVLGRIEKALAKPKPAVAVAAGPA